MAKPIVVLGSGGHARVVAEACRAAGRPPRGILDPARATGTTVGNLPVLGADERLSDPTFVADHEFLVAIGDRELRRKLSLRVRERGGTLASVVHPAAVVAPDVEMGAGTVVLAGVVINPGTRVGDFVIVNTGAIVDHDSVLGHGVQVCPGANLSGGVVCGEDAFIGTGAVVIPGRRVGARAVVAAGAVVIQDVPSDVTVVGNPARIVEPPGREGKP